MSEVPVDWMQGLIDWKLKGSCNGPSSSAVPPGEESPGSHIHAMVPAVFGARGGSAASRARGGSADSRAICRLDAMVRVGVFGAC